MRKNRFGKEQFNAFQCADLGAWVEGDPAYGIALFTLDYGYDALSPKQKAVHDKHIAPLIGRLVEQQKINARIYSAAD